MVSRAQGPHALLLTVCLLHDHFLFTKSRQLNLKLKPPMPSTGRLKVYARVTWLLLLASDARSGLEGQEAELPGHTPASRIREDGQVRPKPNPERLSGWESQSFAWEPLAAGWHRPSFLDVICAFFSKESKMTLQRFAFHFAPTKMFKRAYFLLPDDFGEK